MINIYIDSDVIVASEIKKELNHKESKKFMKYVIKSENSNVRFFTSVFTFLELASAIIRRTNNKDKAYSLLYRIRNTWKGFINPLPPIVSKKASSFTKLVDILIETSIRFRTPSGDTIHAQTEAENDIDYFITWNKKHFLVMEKQIKNLKVLSPTEVLEELERIKKTKKNKKTYFDSSVFNEYFRSHNKFIVFKK